MVDRSLNASAVALGLVVALMSIALGERSAEAAGEIGDVQRVKVWAYGTAPDTTRAPLFWADDVVLDEVVETVEDGALHIRFLDGTKLRLGSASQVTLDTFVYDPSTSAGELTADLGEGVFRFITGKLNKEGIEIRTPVAVIGVRGTDFIVSVAASGLTVVAVLAGTVTVTARGAGGASATATAGRSVTVTEAGQVTTGAAGAIQDTGLQDNAGIGSPDDAGGGGGGGQDSDSNDSSDSEG